jgi:two-component system chemotaxis sensor kinase CheA
MVEWLGQLLKQSTITNILPETKLSILILNLNGEKFGLIVDSVYRQEEIVLKPLPDSYAGVPGLAGASILGDGRAILILDINQLYKIN